MTIHRLTGDMIVNRTSLLVGMFITLVVALSVHVYMLQVLRIPFPEFAGVSVWASLLNTSFSVLAVIIVCGLTQPYLAQLPTFARYLLIFLLYAMLRETLRGALMNGVVTKGWGYDFVAGIPGLAYAFVLTSLVLLLTPRLRGIWLRFPAAVAIAGLMIFAVRPLIGKVFAPALEAARRFDHPEVYTFPYGWHVLVPAYLTYAEPVVACMLLATLTWRGLSAKPAVRFFKFTSLVLLLRGMLIPTFVYSFYSKAKLPAAMLSQSQFLLETLTLALMTAVVWQFSTRSRVEAVQGFARPDSSR